MGHQPRESHAWRRVGIVLAKSEFLGVIVIFCEICGCHSIEYCSIEFVGFSSLPTSISFDWQGRGYAILGACS